MAKAASITRRDALSAAAVYSLPVVGVTTALTAAPAPARTSRFHQAGAWMREYYQEAGRISVGPRGEMWLGGAVEASERVAVMQRNVPSEIVDHIRMLAQEASRRGLL